MTDSPLHEAYRRWRDFLHEWPEAEAEIAKYMVREDEEERQRRLHERSRQAIMRHLRSAKRQ